MSKEISGILMSQVSSFMSSRTVPKFFTATLIDDRLIWRFYGKVAIALKAIENE